MATKANVCLLASLLAGDAWAGGSFGPCGQSRQAIRMGAAQPRFCATASSV